MKMLITIGVCLMVMVGVIAVPLWLFPWLGKWDFENNPYFTIIVPVVEVIATRVICQTILLNV